MSPSRLNQALMDRQARFGLERHFVGICELGSEVFESDQALLVFWHGAFLRKRAKAKNLSLNCLNQQRKSSSLKFSQGLFLFLDHLSLACWRRPKIEPLLRVVPIES